MIIVRLDAPLFFANAVLLRDEIRKLVFAADPRPRAVLIDLEATSELDLSSADMLSELATEMKTQGVAILLGRVHGPVLDFLHRSGAMAEIGDDHIFSTVDQGVQAFLSGLSSPLPLREGQGEGGVTAEKPVPDQPEPSDLNPETTRRKYRAG